MEMYLSGIDIKLKIDGVEAEDILYNIQLSLVKSITEEAIRGIRETPEYREMASAAYRDAMQQIRDAFIPARAGK